MPTIPWVARLYQIEDYTKSRTKLYQIKDKTIPNQGLWFMKLYQIKDYDPKKLYQIKDLDFKTIPNQGLRAYF